MLSENPTGRKVFELIVGIYLKSERLAKQELKTLGVTFSQFRAMMVLSQKDNITQREFADIIETDTTTVMVICDSLEKKGWLRRVSDATDRRVNRLVLTDSGRNVFTQALPLIQVKYEYFLRKISVDELKVAIPVLENIYRNIKECLQQRG